MRSIAQDRFPPTLDEGLRHAAEFVGRRWTLELVDVLSRGPRRFTDLKRELGHASATMLTARLRDLADAGLVVQEELPPPAASVVYRLTERGAGLVPVVAALTLWGRTLGRPVARPNGRRRAA